MTRGDEPSLQRDEVEAIVARVCFPAAEAEPTPGRVGLEVERFPILSGPGGRLTIDGPGPASAAILARCVGLGGRETRRGLPVFPCDGGGHLTFEPGGQLEHATTACATAAEALAEADRVGALVTDAFDRASSVLASAGLDVWHDAETIPLQLDCFRYPAMDAFFSALGSVGRVMMRHTCSLQVNLDLGPVTERSEKWLLANLLSPILTATFANSPTESHVSGRARAWQVIDRTRTGFPAALVDGSTAEPVAQITAAALSADVLLIRTGPETAVPGRPGWTFAHWLSEPDPELGAPTTADLEYHVSTLFHEVRPQGRLEFRGIDAVPYLWRGVPVTFLVGALEDALTRSRLLGLLESHRSTLPGLWQRAAAAGVSDPAFCAVAVEAWSYALAGAARLPSGYVLPSALRDAEAFLERFTLRGRCPADELRERLAEGPETSLAWAAEPVPEPARGAR